LLGKGYCHRAHRAVRANIVAALTPGVCVGGVRAAIPGEAKSGGTERSWAGEFLRLSGWTVEQESVHCADAPFTDVNL
jgi:hypothetical protein